MMASASFQQTLVPLLNRRPFQPFCIELEDGERFLVRRPGALWYRDGGTAVYLRSDGSLDFVNAEAVARIRELAPPRKSGGDGRDGANEGK
jgi:hypothetical protein